MHTLLRRLGGLLAVAVVGLPGLAQASVACGGSLADVIGLGTCTIGGASFTFGPSANASRPIWDAGLFTGDSILGPSAANVTFTPVVTATSAGFTLGGTFNVGGSPSTYIPGKGLFVPGNYMDIQFGYVRVTTPATSSIVGVQLAMGGASVSPDDPNNVVVVSDSGNVAAYDTGTLAQLSDTAALSPTDNFWDLLFVRAWDYSRASTSVAGFTDFTYRVTLQATTPGDGTPAPEPATLGLMGLGLAAIALARPRRRDKR